MNEGTGHGLIGMRERAAAAGGTLSAGTAEAGGYRVTATLPVLNAGTTPGGIRLQRRTIPSGATSR